MSLPYLLATSDGPPIPVPSAGGILPRPLLCGVGFVDAVTAGLTEPGEEPPPLLPPIPPPATCGFDCTIEGDLGAVACPVVIL